MIIYEASLQYRVVQEGPVEALDCPEKVVSYMAGAFDPDPTVEWFYVITLNRKNIPMGRCMLTKGTADSALVHPREVFRPAILAGATGVIVAHNHPSGDPSPSRADITVTRSLRDAAGLLSIDLLDHVIVGEGSHYSFKESGIL